MLTLVVTVSVAALLLLKRKQVKTVILLGLVLSSIGGANALMHHMAVRSLLNDSSSLEFYPWLFYAHLAYLASLGGVVLAGFASLFRSRPAPHYSRALAVGAVTSIVVGLGITLWVVPAIEHVTIVLRQGGLSIQHPAQGHEYEKVKFHQDIHFDEPNLYGDISFPVLFGKDSLSGSINYRGSPVDVSIRAFVGDFWHTKTARTGDDGTFNLTVPEQDLAINRLDFDLWFNRPNDGESRLVIVREPQLAFDGSFFDSADYSESIHLRAGIGELRLEIVDFIETRWPRQSVLEQIANPEEQKIAWTPVEGARHYVITVSKYGNGRKSASEHYQTTTTVPEVALSDLPLVESEEKVEYYVMVRAFSENQVFLSTNRSAFPDSSFLIPGFAIEPNLERRPCGD